MKNSFNIIENADSMFLMLLKVSNAAMDSISVVGDNSNHIG